MASKIIAVFRMRRLRIEMGFHMPPISTHPPKCPHCGYGLATLEWHERVNAHEVQDLWRCRKCKNEFVSVVASQEKEPSIAEITKPFFTSLLV